MIKCITKQWQNSRVFDAMETEAEERAPPLSRSRNEATKIAKGCCNRLLLVCSANYKYHVCERSSQITFR